MKVAACQLPDVHDDLQRTVALIRRSADEAGRRGAQLVCFPECYLQGYDVRPEHVMQVAMDLASSAFAHVLRALEACEPTLVVGLIERQGRKIHNTAVAIARGRVIARYRKRHLLKGELPVFDAGIGTAVFEVGGATVGINICNDLNFPDATAAAADAGADLVACPCNNLMPRAQAEAWKMRHNEVRAVRARHAGVWLLSADVTGEADDRVSYGPTAIIDPDGIVVDQVPLMTTGIVVAEVTSRPHRTLSKETA